MVTDARIFGRISHHPSSLLPAILLTTDGDGVFGKCVTSGQEDAYNKPVDHDVFWPISFSFDSTHQLSITNTLMMYHLSSIDLGCVATVHCFNLTSLSSLPFFYFLVFDKNRKLG